MTWKDDIMGVNESVSPTDNDDILDPEDGKNKEPNKDEDKGNRGIDELRGEFSRKLDNFRSEVTGAIRDGLSAINQNQPAPPRDPSKLRVEELDLSELNGLYLKAENEEQRAYLMNVITDKTAKQVVSQEIRDYDRSQTERQQRQKAAETAVARFPHLKDTSSGFFQEVETELKRMGIAGDAPNGLLTAANEVAIRMGITPGKTRIREAPSKNSDRHNKPVDAGDDDDLGLSEEKFDELADRLASAFPGGKIPEKAKERIIKKSKSYDQFRDHKNSPFIKG